MTQEIIRVYGIFGYPVGHSLSPLLQNEAFKALGINGVYLPFEVKPGALEGAAHALRCLGMAGVNITIPHKEAIIPFLDAVEGDAALTGTVNTVLHRDGKLIGYSTDGEGFLLSLRREAGIEPRGKNIVLLGAGGAARAVAFRLAQEGAGSLYLVNRSKERAEALREDLQARLGFTAACCGFSDPELHEAAANADLVINATSLGMYPAAGEAPPFPLERCPTGCLICDLVYRPRETLWLKKARERGLPVLGGLGMLIYQGMLSCQIWTGRMPPEEPLRAALERVLDR